MIKNEDFSPETILSKVYGFDSFRGRQLEIIESIISGQDTLVLMPTGSGKSLCYQIPALFLDGMAVVVSPLISLMQNQVLALRQLGVEAEFINSTLSQDELLNIKSNISKTKLLYISPERFQQEDFQRWLMLQQISFFAIDEAHCVSRWGHDFRPDYMKLAQIKYKFNKPVIALTATADMKTRVDIPSQLRMENPNIFISSFDRPNIKILAQEKSGVSDQLLDFLEDFKGQSGIIYCLSRKKVDETTKFLIKRGFDAVAYHAGMDQQSRADNQNHFILKDGVIAVATIAFGMGIDKPDVRFVVHLDMPQNLESYYQEIGRAGRDGEPSVALLLYNMQDFSIRGQMIFQNKSPLRMAELGKLQEMLAFSDTLSCKRNYLLSYFGDSPVNCDNCSSCLDQEEKLDVTTLARYIIRTIKDTGEIYGMTYVSLILTGSKATSVKEEHKKLLTYGARKEPEQVVKKTIRQLVVTGFIVIDLDSGYNNLKIIKDVDFSDRVFIRKESKFASRVTAVATNTSDGVTLLKELRTKIANEQNIPPFMVLHDKSIREMARKKPKTLSDLKKIHGWGSVKIERYGETFLSFIKERL